MSSKEQLNDYVKRLKKEIRELKKTNRELNRDLISLSGIIRNLEEDLQESRLKERKWYHLF